MTIDDDTVLQFASPPLPTTTRRIAQLSVVTGPQIGRHFSLTNDTLIGRGADCGVRLEHPGISRHHARVVRLPDQDQYLIEDLGSRNGTRINGQLIQRAALSPGDKVQIGPQSTLLFSLRDLVEEQLLEAQKMVAIGRLSAGITHDFNNLLSVLCANIDYLAQLESDTNLGAADVQECLTELSTTAQRATELTRRLAGIVRGDSDTHETLNFTDLCREVLRMVRRLLPPQVRIEAQIEEGLFIEGSPSRIHQMLMNPCINARDAMPNGGVLSVRAYRGTPGSLDGDRRPQAGPTLDQITLEIGDTGTGMDQSTLEQAFEPFFTTKGPRMGTGLGLATLLTVAKEHSGQARLSSALGKGTTVYITLPARAPNLRTRKTIHQSIVPPGEAESSLVLVVDDDRTVARSAERLLVNAGHRTLYAANGAQALNLFHTHQPRPNLVLLDIDMPVMNGRECLKHLMAEAVAPHVVCMSGKEVEPGPQQLLEQGAIAFLHKPLTAAGLRHALSAAGLAIRC